jgi:hypothetical protein
MIEPITSLALGPIASGLFADGEWYLLVAEAFREEVPKHCRY